MTKETFTDHFLHVEFMCPDMPEATGQGKGNSGVFLQGRYEIQVLDSYGIEVPGKGDCGSIYNQFAPLVNACKPALEWQTYDVIFRAPRLNDAGEMLANVRATVIQNGLVILNNVQLPGMTGANIDSAVGKPGPLLLQDHGNHLKFRNIWAVLDTPTRRFGSVLEEIVISYQYSVISTQSYSCGSSEKSTCHKLSIN